jgi:NhaA family Na+:H+ antiporter
VKLVVGLGNPGPRYAGTRHNAGFLVVDRLAESLGVRLEPGPDGRKGRGRLEGVEFALLEPGELMNRSGGPVARAVAELPVADPARDLLVVCDDLDLPAGQLRLRKQGGHGGHNGLRDVIACLGTQDFPRLRFGVGRPPPGEDPVEHVLSPFAEEEAAALQARLDEAALAARTFLVEGMDAAMNRFNRRGEPAAAGADGGRTPARARVESAAAAAQARSRETGAAMPEAIPARLADRIARPFVRFLELETASALLLLAMTGLALAWANSPFAHVYEHLLHEPVGVSFGAHAFTLSVHHWVNDGLMALFFFLVGMEIKREMVMGDLSTRSRAMLPVMGALGGMVVPALVYLAFHPSGPATRGWGIPMATDIAFAVAAMSVLGSRVPPPLKIFLLALAIADDLGAVAVIAVFYTASIDLQALGAAAALLGLVYAMNLAGVRSFPAYWLTGAVAWFFTHESGVHATVAGVALGLLTPAFPDPDRHRALVDRAREALDHLRDLVSRHQEDHGGHGRHHAVVRLQEATRDSLSPLDYLANRLERPVLFVVMPLFALANAGVAVDGSTLRDPLAGRVALAVALGLLLGKPIGITLFSWAAVRVGLAELPRGVNLLAIFATGMLAGIGFTVALFIAALAFEDPILNKGAKVGILLGSVAACGIGLAALARALPATGRS